MMKLKYLVWSLCSEYRWIDDDTFCVWLNYYHVHEFMDRLNKIRQIEVYDNELDAQIQDNYLCIVLNKRLFDTEELEEIFPKEEYKE